MLKVLFLLLVLQSVFWVSAVFCQRAFSAGYDPDMGFSAGGREKHAYGYYMQGQQCERIGDVHNAVEFYRKSISAFPRVKEVHHALAKLLARTGSNEPAMAEFRTALNIDFNFVECRNNYGAFLKRLDKVDEAASQFRQCIQIDPKFPYAYYNLGLILKEKGDLEGAIENLEHCTRLKPDFAEAQEALGLCIFERASSGDLTTAAEKLQLAAKLLPKNPKIHYHLGIISSTQSNLDGGETEFRKALMCDPRFSAAHFELGKLRYYRGDLDRCLSELREAQNINPTYTDSQQYPALEPVKLKSLEANAFEFSGDLVKALETYQQLVAMRKSDALYAKHITELDKQIKQEIKSRKKKPLPYDPQEVDAFIAKGIEQYEDGDLEGARASFERAAELNPASFRATQNLCFVQEAQGDLNSAVATSQKAIPLNPRYDGAVYNLAYLLEKMNLPDDAARMYQNFRDMAQQYPYDPQHIIELQQNIIRAQKKEEFIRKRGY